MEGIVLGMEESCSTALQVFCPGSAWAGLRGLWKKVGNCFSFSTMLPSPPLPFFCAFQLLACILFSRKNIYLYWNIQLSCKHKTFPLPEANPQFLNPFYIFTFPMYFRYMPHSDKWRYKLMTAVIWLESVLWTHTCIIIIHCLTFVITLLSGAAMHGFVPFPVLLSTSPAWVLLPGQTFLIHSVSRHCSPVLTWERQGCCYVLSLFCYTGAQNRALWPHLQPRVWAQAVFHGVPLL